MTVQILPAASRPISRWRNGGGETSEITRHPSSGEEEWWWRASIATIAQDGPFSPFPGCDRLLVPLDGAVRLCIAGAQREAPKLGLLHFRGEDDVRAIDVTHPTTDLNVIVSRDRGLADLTIGAEPGSRYSPKHGRFLLIVALSNDVLADTVSLVHLDAVLLEPGDGIIIERGLVAVIEITDLR